MSSPETALRWRWRGRLDSTRIENGGGDKSTTACLARRTTGSIGVVPFPPARQVGRIWASGDTIARAGRNKRAKMGLHVAAIQPGMDESATELIESMPFEAGILAKAVNRQRWVSMRSSPTWAAASSRSARASATCHGCRCANASCSRTEPACSRSCTRGPAVFQGCRLTSGAVSIWAAAVRCSSARRRSVRYDRVLQRAQHIENECAIERLLILLRSAIGRCAASSRSSPRAVMGPQSDGSLLWALPPVFGRADPANLAVSWPQTRNCRCGRSTRSDCSGGCGRR